MPTNVVAPFVALITAIPITFISVAAHADLPPHFQIADRDLNGDGIAETIKSYPYAWLNDATDDEIGPGEVHIFDGASGVLATRLIGSADRDAFGYSVSATTDYNGDGLADLIVGAPGEGSGAAYLFYGPFDVATGDLHATNAAAVFIPDRAGVEVFGAGVAPFTDITDDGIPDIRVRALDANGNAITTYYCGVTFSYLKASRGPLSDALWEASAVDLDDDGDVDDADFVRAVTQIGQQSSDGTVYADVDQNGFVEITDAIVCLEAMADNNLAAMLRQTGCDCPIPPGEVDACCTLNEVTGEVECCEDDSWDPCPSSGWVLAPQADCDGYKAQCIENDPCTQLWKDFFERSFEELEMQMPQVFCMHCNCPSGIDLFGKYSCESNQIVICIDEIDQLPLDEQCDKFRQTWIEEHLHALQKALGIFDCQNDCEQWFCAEYVAAYLIECTGEHMERFICALPIAGGSVSPSCGQEIKAKMAAGQFNPDDCFSGYGPICGGCDDFREPIGWEWQEDCAVGDSGTTRQTFDPRLR